MADTHAAGWGPGPGDGSRRWGHWAPQVLIGAIAATVLLAVAPMPTGNPLTALTPLLLLGVVIATWVQMRRHDRTLCEHCMAAMPLNPSLSAQRYERRLALAHLGQQPAAVLGYLAILLGADLAVAVAPDAVLHPVLALWACTQLSLVYLVLSHVTHRRLQPWCARCGGGGGEDVQAPEPAPFDSRTG